MSYMRYSVLFESSFGRVMAVVVGLLGLIVMGIGALYDRSNRLPSERKQKPDPLKCLSCGSVLQELNVVPLNDIMDRDIEIPDGATHYCSRHTSVLYYKLRATMKPSAYEELLH